MPLRLARYTGCRWQDEFSFHWSAAASTSGEQLHHLLVVGSAKAGDGIPTFECRESLDTLQLFGAASTRAGVNVRKCSWICFTTTAAAAALLE